jgi:hypothetical protein
MQVAKAEPVIPQPSPRMEVPGMRENIHTGSSTRFSTAVASNRRIGVLASEVLRRMVLTV